MGFCWLLRRWLPAALLLAMMGCATIASSSVLTAGAPQTPPSAGQHAWDTAGSHQGQADQMISSPASAPQGRLCTDDDQSALNAKPSFGSAGVDSAPDQMAAAARLPETPSPLTGNPCARGSLNSPAGLLVTNLSVRRT